MIIFKEDKRTGLSCGLNDDGYLFIGDDSSGETMMNTAKNKALILQEFDRIIERDRRLAFMV